MNNSMMKPFFLLVFLLCSAGAFSQKVALKNNLAYDALKTPNLSLKDHRYEGYFWGGGLSVGYQWVLSNRFNIEASLGIGYVHARYDKYKCTTCGQKLGKGDADYIGPTRAAISIIYMLK